MTLQHSLPHIKTITTSRKAKESEMNGFTSIRCNMGMIFLGKVKPLPDFPTGFRESTCQDCGAVCDVPIDQMEEALDQYRYAGDGDMIFSHDCKNGVVYVGII